jgi:hypothetical protein
MFFVGLLVLCSAAFAVGFAVQRTWLVPVLSVLGAAVVIIDAVSRHHENPALVAVVQVSCAAVIVGCSALGVLARGATRKHTRPSIYP